MVIPAFQCDNHEARAEKDQEAGSLHQSKEKGLAPQLFHNRVDAASEDQKHQRPDQIAGKLRCRIQYKVQDADQQHQGKYHDFCKFPYHSHRRFLLLASL